MTNVRLGVISQPMGRQRNSIVEIHSLMAETLASAGDDDATLPHLQDLLRDSRRGPLKSIA
jgi:hypothetical protein